MGWDPEIPMFVYRLSTEAFMLQWQSCVIVTETVWSLKAEDICSLIFDRKKLADV